MTDFLTDLRFAIRTLRRRPMANAVAILSLALAIGAATTVYALVDAILLDPLPISAPDRMVRVYYGDDAEPRGNWTYADYVDAAAVADWERSAATAHWQVSLAANDGSGALLVESRLVSTSYFATLGVTPVLGRTFTPSEPAAAEARDGAEIVLGYDLWQRAFGADPQIVGRTVRLSGRPFEVVGVAPRGFRGIRLDEPADLWVPLGNYRYLATGFFKHFDAVAYPRSSSGNRLSMWDVIARLAPTSSVERAAAELDSVTRAVKSTAGSQAENNRLSLEPLDAAALPSGDRDNSRRFLTMLSAAVAALFAVACLNVANLLIARGVERRNEIGLRLAVGCRPSRIVRQLLTESLVLAVASGFLGLLVASWGLGLLGTYRLPGDVPVASLGLELEPRTIMIGLFVSLLSCLAFGLVPAISAARRGQLQALGTDRGGIRSDRRRGLLVAAQVGFSLVLLVGAGLFLRSVDRALTSDLGFSTDRLLTVTVDPSMAPYDAARAAGVTEALTERARALPGVEGIALTSTIFGDQGLSQIGLQIEGRDEESEAHVAKAWVSPGYFEVMGIRLLRGRDFESRDSENAPGVVVINQSMAETLWPGTNAVGKRIRFASFGRPDEEAFTEVVGVVADSRYWSLRQRGQLYAYFPIEQHPQAFAQGELSILVKHHTGATLVSAMRESVAQTAPDLPIAAVRTMEERVAALVMPERLGRIVLMCFAMVAVLIAACGIAAVVAQGVARRQREIGVRLALGADGRSVIGLFVRRALIPTAWGLVAGLVAAAAASQALEAFLYDIEPLDPLTFAVSATAFLVIATLASLVPARAAARVDPMSVLRSE